MMRFVSAERNRGPILTSLKRFIDSSSGNMLEIASGSGHHVLFFAENFPNIEFQPTEFELSLLVLIDANSKHFNLTNVLPAKYLDVIAESNQWLDGELSKKQFDYVLNINMMHISEWQCTEGLFKGSSRALKPNGKLFTYGPYADNGVITPQSNIEFNNCLKSLNPAWGLRDITKQLIPTAFKYGLTLTEKVEMPSNNYFLVWCKSI